LMGNCRFYTAIRFVRVGAIPEPAVCAVFLEMGYPLRSTFVSESWVELPDS